MIRFRSARWCLALVVGGVSLLPLGTTASAIRPQTDKAQQPGWQPLFDGKTLSNWQSTRFFGEGIVTVENGQIILEAGNALTGITWIGPELPTTNYEIALQAMRVDGRDFFAGVTFPVADSFCSLILGGWGGTVVGLSSINGMDASENETSQSIDFESRRWYSVRIRVTAARIEAWLDERQIVNQDLKGNKIDTRVEVEPSRPLGVASWRTKSALRDLRLRRLTPTARGRTGAASARWPDR
jgi:hypothetical protein